MGEFDEYPEIGDEVTVYGTVTESPSSGWLIIDADYFKYRHVTWKVSASSKAYIITVIPLPTGRTHYGFCSIFMPGRRMPMDKIIIALLGAAAVIVQQIFSDDD